MIIFGTRGVTYSHGHGDFHCPACTHTKPYKHKRVRRFFTLYFIPVIPLDLVGEYVECQHCAGTYVPEVLSFDHGAADAKFEAEFQRAIKRVMVLMMIADDVIEGDEMIAIREIYKKLAGQDITDEELLEEVEQAKQDKRDLTEYLSGLVGSLNQSGKELVFKAAFFVAAADGIFQDEERALLLKLTKALQMSVGQFNALIDQLTAEDDAGE